MPQCRPGLRAVARLRLVFFFQAEDGIRDLTVTGVQTCALPICFGDDQRGDREQQRDVQRGATRAAARLGGDVQEDRKSTRLNSSHSQISYAVFCLKKKKNALKRGYITPLNQSLNSTLPCLLLYI